MAIKVSPSGQACGATVTEVRLDQELSAELIAEIRNAWLEYHVLAFPDQRLSDDDLERFSQAFGDFGDDPFIAPIDGHEHIIAVRRDADESGPIFAEAWHTDWSFQAIPPAGTCLYSIKIPSKGGDTLFANQHLALSKMPMSLRAKLENLQAIHSAQLAYAPDGAYGDQDSDRSMDIRPHEDARKLQRHPIIRAHPETRELGVFGCAGYIIGFDGLEQSESEALLMELHAWQTQEQFQYRHCWQEDMLLMWDNRSVLHSATGGYEGETRLLHRTTIADKPYA
jgi:taurine dioxygenase